jgi:Sec-independent protein translocase protein TatA
MTKCPQCGKDVSFFERDLITGTCPACRGIGARPATLGCGTLLLIGLVVWLVVGSKVNRVRDEVTELRSEVAELKRAVEQETAELRALREAIEASAPPTTRRPE